MLSTWATANWPGSCARTDRVTLLERTNVRTLPALPGGVRVDLAAIDVSFIGLDLVLPAVAHFLRPGGQVVALIKPQFEAGKGRVEKGGVVRDPAVHRDVLARVLAWAAGHGWTVEGLIRSPITGPKGNVEFLVLLRYAAPAQSPDYAALIAGVLPAGG
jgi:23S rRNA (cytidine1920-2'-O)/16S rRNA (cytidine1409-2'-O)-methyltransferase